MKITKSKKAQMEMVGLVVIVILITLAMLFMAIFALKEEPTKKIFTRKGLAYSTMSTTIKTTVFEENCIDSFLSKTHPQIGKDLIEDCAGHIDSKEENGFSTYRCGELHSCLYLNKTITHMLNQTLGSWGKRYEFQSRLLGFDGQAYPEPLVHVVSPRGACPANRERDTSGLFPLSTEFGQVENYLFICD